MSIVCQLIRAGGYVINIFVKIIDSRIQSFVVIYVFDDCVCVFDDLLVRICLDIVG